jgi:uncharacterized protein (UPF0305 family)
MRATIKKELSMSATVTIKKISDFVETSLETLEPEEAIDVLESLSIFCTDRAEEIRESIEVDEEEEEDEEDE